MRRICAAALFLAALLSLSGCSAMLERSYQVVTDHPEHPATADDSGVLKAESYQDLVNDILYFVNQGTESGVIRMINYTRDVETDLNNACLEVARDAPLGAYAVDFIKYDYTPVVKYYEANITISYRRTQEQIHAIQNVTGTSAIRAELQEALLQFSSETVLHIAYFNENEDYIASLIQQTYYDTPAAAFGMPEYTISLYPETGSERIVEILLQYPDTPESLRRKSAQLRQQAEQLTTSLSGQTNADLARSLLTMLRNRVEVVTDRNGDVSTAYAALMENRANSEGIALAFQLLCQQLDLECILVQGTQNGAPHFWNIITLEEGVYRHVDASQKSGLFYTDGELTALSYTWDTTETPACGNSSLTPSP